MASEPESPPRLTLRNTLREGLSIPKVVGNPLRRGLKREPFGNGRPVIVMPGLLTGDLSTTFLRRSLKVAGFDARGWKQGINVGASPAKLAGLEKHLARLHLECGQRAVLLGWSLGGLYARVLAQRMPEATELVMTVASPFSGDRRANRAWRLYELINDHSVENPPFLEDVSRKPDVRTIAVWSGVDGVISPECTMGQQHEADYRVRVDAQHFALGSSGRSIARIIEILHEHLDA